MLDAHVHLWDTRAVSYTLFDGDPQLSGRWGPERYFRDAAQAGVDRIIVVEAASAGADGRAEAQWLCSELAADDRIGGVVAWAPLESRDLDQRLDELLALDGLPVVGIRRSFEFEEPDFACSTEVVRGVQSVGARGLVVDLVLYASSLGSCIELVRRAPETQFVLDHLGKPAVRERELGPWKIDVAELAAFPNVVAKISGLVTEAGAGWTAADLAPYVEHALECFGPHRLMFGSDWPIVERAGGISRWMETVDTLCAGLAPDDRDAIRGGTAARTYLSDDPPTTPHTPEPGAGTPSARAGDRRS